MSLYVGNNIMALCTLFGAGIGICPGTTMTMWLANCVLGGKQLILD